MGQHNRDHTGTGRSLLCWHISQNAHMDWHLWIKRLKRSWTVHITHALIMVVKEKKKRNNNRLTNRALIHVLVASTAYKASRTGANGTTIQRVGVTDCTFVARITDTCIIKVAQQTCGEIQSPRQLVKINFSISAVRFHTKTSLMFDSIY